MTHITLALIIHQPALKGRFERGLRNARFWRSGADPRTVPYSVIPSEVRGEPATAGDRARARDLGSV